MKFRNYDEKRLACMRLAELARRPDFWTEGGPAEPHTVVLTLNERVYLNVIHALHHGDKTVRLADLMFLDDERLAWVGSLLVALARWDVESWLVRT